MDGVQRLPGTPSPMRVWGGADGNRISGDCWGDPRNPHVFLLHGVGQTRHAWGETGRVLAATGYRVIAPDARGHGDSDWVADGDYSRDAMIRDLRCLADAEGCDRPIVIGASMGGITGLLAVGEQQIEARALILVDVAVQVEEAGVARVNQFMAQNLDGFGSLDEVADAIDRYRQRKNTSRNLAGLSKNVRQGVDGRFYWHWDPKINSRQRDSAERRLEAAHNVNVPTLLVRGGQSDVLSEEGARLFLEHCPHSELVNVVGAGHMVAGDRNDIFARAAIDFLRRVAPVDAEV
jgi:pimeloyl-ACP methyl ester carboxylesterase